ncbi:acetylglutamate kinase [Hyphobacterium sp.]|jgi:acetylglutamate kinase|uniref:acetylglutamate kinase n=1 Tax=Hyphobacterium sp. TaxID=2004662 RepID=UPI003BA970F5
MTDATRETIIQLLSHMRDGKEVRDYLNRFSRLDQSRFAVVKVGGAVIRDDLDGLAAALAFLQSVGLSPVIVHGGGPQLDAALRAAGIGSERVDGLRVTPERAMPVVRQALSAANIAIVDAIRSSGGRAASVPAGVFMADLIDEEVYGRVGMPTHTDLGLVEAAVRGGEIPVLACLGETPDGKLVNINADHAVAALVKALQPYKIIFLTETGGLLDDKGEIISTLNLASDREHLMSAGWITGGMRVKIDQIQALLDELPLTSSVSITSPGGLTQELFTHAGAGTLVRRGERLLAITERREVDWDRLEALIATSFGRAPVAGYRDRVAFDRLFVTENYRAAALLTRIDDTAYLDKFAVLEEARGEGLARAVWQAMIHYAPRLYWRSKTANPVNSFYFQECDGAAKTGPWTVFWKGEAELGRMPTLVERIASLPETLERAS